jgi:antitoxin MazE
MKAELIRIGNSQGIRIPKAIIEQCGFGRSVELRVEGRSLVVTPARAAREGWDEAFAAMTRAGDDGPLLPEDLARDWDEAEWEW